MDMTLREWQVVMDAKRQIAIKDDLTSRERGELMRLNAVIGRVNVWQLHADGLRAAREQGLRDDQGHEALGPDYLVPVHEPFSVDIAPSGR